MGSLVRSSVALLLTLAPALTAANDWPQFRGPDSNPVGAGNRLPERWSKTENVEWSLEIPGRGWSSPIVSGNKVFVTTVVTEGKSKPPQVGTEYSNEYAAELMKQGLSQAEMMAKLMERDIELPKEVVLHYVLYCLDLKSGAVTWKKEFYSGRPPGGRHRKNSFISETPVTDGKFVYIFVGNLGLYAFDFDGKQVWNTPVESYPIYLEFGTGGSPVLHKDQLIMISDNQKRQYIASFDKRTGKQIWRTDRNLPDDKENSQRSGWTTPFIWTNKLRTEIIAIGPGSTISYDLAGKELWRLGGMSVTPVPSPFMYEGLLYVDAGRSRALYAVRPGASGDISLAKADTSNEFVAWSDARGGTYLPTPVAYSGAVYALTETGIISRFDAKTGALTYKARIAPDAGFFTSSPWAYNGKVFCLSEEGKTFVLGSGEKFELLHVNDLDEMAQATPAIVGDRLLLRTESRLYSIRTKR